MVVSDDHVFMYRVTDPPFLYYLSASLTQLGREHLFYVYDQSTAVKMKLTFIEWLKGFVKFQGKTFEFQLSWK